MRKRKLHTGFHEPSLVPLADMLTNTVGIMIFILIFTVLAAAAALIPKRLPMEHQTEATELFYVCVGNRLLPIDRKSFEQFMKPLGKPASYDDVDAWIKRFNKRQIEDEYFILKGDGDAYYSNSFFERSVRLSLSVIFTPQEGKGETKEDLRLPSARFRQILSEKSPTDFFVYFIVHPNSLDVFATARALVIGMNFETGWMPLGADKPIRIGLTGGGQVAGPQ